MVRTDLLSGVVREKRGPKKKDNNGSVDLGICGVSPLVVFLHCYQSQIFACLPVWRWPKVSENLQSVKKIPIRHNDRFFFQFHCPQVVVIVAAFGSHLDERRAAFVCPPGSL